MLFDFELRPLEDIAPWSSLSLGSGESLHWFGLTDGFYWLDTGAGELFRYSDALVKHWAQTYPNATVCSYVDYQVARLWEDILYMLPSVLEPIPDDLATHIRPEGLWGTDAGWDHWTSRAFEWADRQEDKTAWDELESAFRWWSDRRLDAGHLTTKPDVWFWREDDLHIRWDNSDRLIDGVPAWASAAGHVSLSVPDFLAEVGSFNDRLMRQMAERVEAIQRHWSRPEMHIDREGLVKDHQYRSTLLDSALARTPQTDWDAVRTALSEMERHSEAT